MTDVSPELAAWTELLESRESSLADPDEQFQAMLELLQYYRDADHALQSMIRTRGLGRVLDDLLPFTKSAAEEAVQLQSIDRLVSGMEWLSIGSEQLDPRDVIICLALLANSAEKLGVELNQVFQLVNDQAGAGFQAMVSEFVARDQEDRSIYEMGYKEAGEGPLFRYMPHGEFGY